MQTEKQTSAQATQDPLGEKQRLIDKRNKLWRIDDDEWEKIVRVIPRRLRTRAVRDPGMRVFVEAVFWLADTGLVWRMLPQEYGAWRGNYVRFIRWAEKGIWRGVAVSLNDYGLRSAVILLADDYVKRRRRLRMMAGEEDE